MLASAVPTPDLSASAVPVGGVLRGPEKRCADTALHLGLAAGVDPELRDQDHGVWRRRSLAEVQAADPAGVAAWLTDPGAAPHGGESLRALLTRVGEWLDRLPAGRVTAITHPAVVRAAIVHALGAPPGAWRRLDPTPLARVTLTGRDGRWNVRL
ncbi:histidine phosphatase family protein [Sinosporangium siamense]|uniref:Phosphoglycerate mutase n=2 Tax=Sinosporangium siamense TaxID=1367973 RepID=A0A919RHA8_9ACTN|nr:histidine phosphatase family protein [Sinosporangium siamense]GII93876.1 phosphoglycerate mutase [Sinosporangium siamense]